MRKNYFAKKFVAYSMAFAVAFSTLTVSPVFVKEAKAAAATSAIFIPNSGDATKYKVKLSNAFSPTATVANGNVFLSNVTSDDLTDGTTMSSQEFLTNSKLSDKIINGKTIEQQNGVIPNTAEVNYGLLDGTTDPYISPTPVKMITGQEETADLNATGLTANTTYTWYKLVPGKGTFTYPEMNNGVARNDVITYNYFTLRKLNDATTARTGDASTKLTKSLAATAENVGLYLLTDGSTIVEFFDVCEESDLKATVTKDTVYATKGSTVTITANISSSKTTTCKWYKAGVELKDFENKNVLTLTELKDSDFVGYTCEVTDGIRTINLDVSVSELTATEMGKVKADEYNTTAKVLTTTAAPVKHYLQNGKLTLTTVIPDGDYHYIWLDESNNIVKLTTSDALAYDSTRKSITITDASEITGANDTITCYAVPNSIYNADGDVKAALKKLAEATNDADKYAAIETATTFTSLRAAEKTLATTAAKVVYKETITLKPVTDVIGSEVIASDSKTVSIGSKVTLDAPVLKDKLPVSYTWTNANGDTYGTTGSQLVIDNVDQKDLGTITCTVTYCKHPTKCADVKTHKQLQEAVTAVCGCSDNSLHAYTGGDATANNAAHIAYLKAQNEGTIAQNINLVYASDLTATGSDVQVRDGQAAELSVTAKASVVPTYKWEKVTETLGGNDVITPSPAAIPGVKDTEATLKLTTVTKAANDYYTEKFVANKRYYYQCTVSDGINTIYVPVKITEVETFKVYKDQKALYLGDVLGDGKDANGNNIVPATNELKLYYGGLKGDSITLAPIVVANPEVEKDITYTWKKDGIAYSTDKAITVNCDGNAATYQLTITEGTAPLTIEYNVKTLTEKQLQAASINGGNVDVEGNNTYTGKEINPVNKVTVVVNDAPNNYTYTLKENTDYTVSLTDAINAGVSKYEVVLTGNFADAYSKLTEAQKDGFGFRGIFTITRADNKVEIADNTVVVGKSVLPKVVTNLGKGALTYTYYADAAATTEIAAPTKVGTYYVKATAAATMNYNEAESNVAKVVIAPSTTKVTKVATNANAVKLTWSKVTGATAYRVYIKKSGKWTKVADTKSLTYTVKKLASATKYEFAVKAFAGSIASPKYVTKTAYTTPAKVATPAVKAGSRKATVSFKKVAGATGYQVYMAKGNGKYAKIATTTKLSVTKTKLTKGATYKFKVRAYKKVGSTVYYGAFSSAKAVKVK